MPIYDKNSLATDLQLTAGIGLEPALKFIDILTATIAIELKKGNKVCTDLGNFYVKNNKARVGTNPQTHALLNIAEQNSIELKASKELKAAINE